LFAADHHREHEQARVVGRLHHPVIWRDCRLQALMNFSEGLGSVGLYDVRLEPCLFATRQQAGPLAAGQVLLKVALHVFAIDHRFRDGSFVVISIELLKLRE
jgi:hypothetical protein